MSKSPKTSKSWDESGDKTEVLTGVQETLNRELQNAKQQEACLIVIRGPEQGHRFFLTNDTMVVGRDATADISIPDKSISRQHARLEKAGENIVIVDMGSANGTIINGKKMPPSSPAQLAKEDMVRLGNVILKYVPAGAYEILFYGDMDSKAYTDSLTQISNKRYLEERLDAEFKRSRALGDDFSVVFMDVDFFKKLNDQFGHDAGDFVLRELASLVRGKFVGPKDVFARYGGEEFVICYVKKTAQQAAESAELIRAGIQSHAFVFQGQRLPVTMSFGVAELDSLMEHQNALLKKADGALYDSKRGGRNRVTVAP